MQPNPEYAPWLAERCGKERPFLQYHAAIALRNAADQLPEQDHPKIKAAILDAKQRTQDEEALRVLGQAEAIIAESR